MATGRTLLKWTRFYMAGYDLSGNARTPGPLTWEYEESDLTGMSNDAMGNLPGKATITPSALNGNLDNTATSGLHVVASSPGSGRVVTIPIGIRAAPGPGDPVFVGKYQQVDYSLDPTSAYVNITFDEWDASGLIAYDNPWGVKLHAASAETAVNSAAGIDDNGGATTQGGYLVYQVLAGNGTATIKVQDAAVNADGSFR